MNKATLRELSDELVALQRPIRVLDAVAWTEEVATEFFRHRGTRQPAVDADYYRRARPLGFDPAELRRALGDLRGRVAAGLGDSSVASLMSRRIDEYVRVVDMLEWRGTSAFATTSAELYGTVTDRLHPGGPTLAELCDVMTDALANIAIGSWEPEEGERFDAATAVEILRDRLATTFSGDDEVHVLLDDGIVADAAAGSDYIKLREDATFTARELRVLEVHEGWVHVATSLNGRRQDCCTFLGKGTPSTTATQEGLAVFAEITTMSSTPARLARVTQRMIAIGMALDGATFLDVYRWYLDVGLDEQAAWASSVRVFRGSAPELGPFTKDLVYSRGFLEVYDTVRLAVRRGLLDRVRLLFVGKMNVYELGAIAGLVDEGLVTPPAHLPPHVADISALAAWMAYSNLFNRIDLDVMEEHLADALS